MCPSINEQVVLEKRLDAPDLAWERKYHSLNGHTPFANVGIVLPLSKGFEYAHSARE